MRTWKLVAVLSLLGLPGAFATEVTERFLQHYRHIKKNPNVERNDRDAVAAFEEVEALRQAAFADLRFLERVEKQLDGGLRTDGVDYTFRIYAGLVIGAGLEAGVRLQSSQLGVRIGIPILIDENIGSAFQPPFRLDMIPFGLIASASRSSFDDSHTPPLFQTERALDRDEIFFVVGGGDSEYYSREGEGNSRVATIGAGLGVVSDETSRRRANIPIVYLPTRTTFRYFKARQAYAGFMSAIYYLDLPKAKRFSDSVLRQSVERLKEVLERKIELVDHFTLPSTAPFASIDNLFNEEPRHFFQKIQNCVSGIVRFAFWGR